MLRGFLSDPRHHCTCSTHQIEKYLSKFPARCWTASTFIWKSWRFIPRRCSLQYLRAGNLRPDPGTSYKARVIQIERFKDGNAARRKTGGSATYCGGNAHMNHRQIKQYCALDEECKKLLKMAIDELGLGPGLRQNPQDLEDHCRSGGEEALRTEHLAEAIQYRSLIDDIGAGKERIIITMTTKGYTARDHSKQNLPHPWKENYV